MMLLIRRVASLVATRDLSPDAHHLSVRKSMVKIAPMNLMRIS